MTNPALDSTPARRLVSLDILRGITIAFMIMVNNNGGRAAWAQMHHAEWNGLTATDLVFPTFLFVVGASIVFAFAARLAKGATRAQLAWHTARRAAILFLLGIVVNSFPYFELPHMRFYGVLQRIAVCYLLVGLFYLWDRRVWTKVAALALVLLGYWVLVRWVPVPGAGLPVRDIPFLDQNQNIVAWLDRQLMPYHLYEDFTTHNLRDPEGLLSDIPALGTALLGLLTGLWLRSQANVEHQGSRTGLRLRRLSGLGLLLVDMVSLEQKNVDQFLCIGCGGLVAGRLCLDLLGSRGQRLRQRRRLEQMDCPPLAGLRFQCHRGLHGQRVAPRYRRSLPLHLRWPQDDRLLVGAPPYLRTDSRPRLGSLFLLSLLRGHLPHSGLDPLPKENIPESLTASRRDGTK